MAKKKYTNKVIRDAVYKVTKQAKKDFYDCAKKTNNIMRKEVIDMYKTLITQFYEYRTVRYIRHGEPFAGTQEGTNLYAGGDKHKITIKNEKSSPQLHIKISSEGMEGGYRYDTPEHVLDCVLHGIRFPFGVPVSSGGQREAMMVDPRTMIYNGKYIHYNGGTIYDAFMQFDKEWGTISRSAFYPMWGLYVKKWVK